MHATIVDGELLAFITPRSANVATAALSLRFLDDYSLPRIVPVKSVPLGTDGAVDEMGVRALLRQSSDDAALRSSVLAAGDASSVSKRVQACLLEVTGVRARPDEHLADTAHASLPPNLPPRKGNHNSILRRMH